VICSFTAALCSSWRMTGVFRAGGHAENAMLGRDLFHHRAVTTSLSPALGELVQLLGADSSELPGHGLINLVPPERQGSASRQEPAHHRPGRAGYVIRLRARLEGTYPACQVPASHRRPWCGAGAWTGYFCDVRPGGGPAIWPVPGRRSYLPGSRCPRTAASSRSWSPSLSSTAVMPRRRALARSGRPRRADPVHIRNDPGARRMHRRDHHEQHHRASHAPALHPPSPRAPPEGSSSRQPVCGAANGQLPLDRSLCGPSGHGLWPLTVLHPRLPTGRLRHLAGAWLLRTAQAKPAVAPLPRPPNLRHTGATRSACQGGQS
jgi:hypothetical protein